MKTTHRGRRGREFSGQDEPQYPLPRLSHIHYRALAGIMLSMLVLALLPATSAQIPATQILFPDSVPAQTQWTAFGGGDCVAATKWNCVDEIPRDVTTYLRNSVNVVTQYQSIGFGNFSLDAGIGLEAIDSVELYSWVHTIGDITQRIETFVGAQSCGNITVPTMGAGVWTNVSMVPQNCGAFSWDSSTLSRLYAVYSCANDAGGVSEQCFWTSAHVVVHYRYIEPPSTIALPLLFVFWLFLIIIGFVWEPLILLFAGIVGIVLAVLAWAEWAEPMFPFLIAMISIVWFIGGAVGVARSREAE